MSQLIDGLLFVLIIALTFIPVFKITKNTFEDLEKILERKERKK